MHTPAPYLVVALKLYCVTLLHVLVQGALQNSLFELVIVPIILNGYRLLISTVFVSRSCTYMYMYNVCTLIQL